MAYFFTQSADRASILAEAGGLIRQHRTGEARQLFTRALDAAPDDAVLHTELARLLFPAGDKSAALRELKTAVACDADYAPAQLFLGIALLDSGQGQAALDPLTRAVQLWPGNPQAQYHYGVVCQLKGDLSSAVQAFTAALQIKPDYALAEERLGECYIGQDRGDLALPCFQRLLARQPDSVRAHYGCGMALVRINLAEEAVAEFRKAADHPGAKLALAGALRAAGHVDEACQGFAALLQENPENAGAAIGYADTLTELGRLDEAYSAYIRAIGVGPDYPAYYRRLLSLGDAYPLPAAQRASLMSLADRADSLSANDRAELYFALYRLCDQEGNDKAAIRHLLAANAVKRSQLNYDEAAELSGMEEIAAVTPKSVMIQAAGRGNPSELPVFIVGMPRSGTTLTEQILASHPGVFGGGEIPDFPNVLSDYAQEKAPNPAQMSAADTERLAQAYLDRLHALAPDAERVVDKLPWNFQLVGYIHTLLPGAHIIHIVRDPMATCFSCFEQSLRGNLPFCADLTELGHYYRAYEGLMAHWRAVLPENAMLEVQYESLVSDFEPQARRLIAYCGLEWDPACLNFYQAKRAVRTASASQVRQPIYRGAVGRWKRYASALEPLSHALSGDEMR